MNVFCIAAVPVFYITVKSLVKDLSSVKDDGYKPFIYGLCCFVVSVLIYNIIRMIIISPDFSTGGIYMYYLLHDNLLQAVLAAVSFLLVFGLPDKGKKVDAFHFFSFFSGFFCLWQINDLIISYGWYNTYNLLILPLARISTIMLFSMFAYFAFSRDGWKSIFFAACFAAVPFIMTFTGLLWRLSNHVVAAVLAAVPVAVCLFFIIREMTGKSVSSN